MAYGKVVDAVFRVATLEERVLTHCQEGASAEAAHLRYGLQRLAVLYRYLLR